MAFITVNNLKSELIMFTRKNVTDPSNRGTSTTQTFSGDGATTTFQLTHTDVAFVSALTISAVSQTEFRDFTVDYDPNGVPGLITFTTAPAVGVNNISVTYRYGQTWVFPDFPKDPAKLTDYPRISIDATSYRSKEISIGGTSLDTDILFTVYVFSNNTREVDKLLNQLRQAIMNNKKNFVLVPFVTVDSLGNMTADSSKDGKVVMREMILICPHKVEF